MKVYHDDKLLSEFDDIDKALDFVGDYLSDKSSGYIRSWVDDKKVIWFDYGSHVSFVKVVTNDENS